MRKTIRHIASLSAKPMSRIHDEDGSALEESPCSPYLRFWLGRQAARHRELLLNIDAAARIGLAPVIVGR